MFPPGGVASYQAPFKTATVSGKHNFHQPSGGSPADVEVSAVDEPSGVPLLSGASVYVFPRDDAHRVAVRAKRVRSFDGVLARVSVPSTDQTNELAVTINWGDGTRSAGAITLPSTPWSPGSTKLGVITGRHVWHQAGVYVTTLTISDRIGPQTVEVQGTATVSR